MNHIHSMNCATKMTSLLDFTRLFPSQKLVYFGEHQGGVTTRALKNYKRYVDYIAASMAAVVRTQYVWDSDNEDDDPKGWGGSNGLSAPLVPLGEGGMMDPNVKPWMLWKANINQMLHLHPDRRISGLGEGILMEEEEIEGLFTPGV